jgi:pSer/pThr/pTyr-binding forkhead associated (FHA) protein
MGICLAMAITDGGERRFPLAGSCTVLGSGTRCDLRVALPSVAIEHCEIKMDGDTLTLRDLDSPTGTFHNGTKVQFAELAHNDRLTVGPVTFVVRNDQATSTNSG